MNSKAWLKIFVLLSFLSMGFVGLVNYIVDPSYIYTKQNSEINPDMYAKKLITSQSGLVADGWNERSIKTSLAKLSNNYECLILGSSHIMQISEIRNTGKIKSICPKLLNLGVSGGSFEDLFVFSKIIFDNKTKSQKIFIDITPWLFKFNMDTRYKMNQSIYDEFLLKLNKTELDISKNSYQIDLLKNLFNLEYFITSVKSYKSLFESVKIEKPIGGFTFEDGYSKAITLQDGSHLYDSNFIAKSKKEIQTIKNGGGDYKIDGNIFDNRAIELFEKFITFAQSNKIEIHFIMTPYHPSVFKNGNTKPVQHMREVEKLAKNLAEKYNINIYGSFFPQNIGCKENEFLDFMHPNSVCLDKIKFN